MKSFGIAVPIKIKNGEETDIWFKCPICDFDNLKMAKKENNEIFGADFGWWITCKHFYHFVPVNLENIKIIFVEGKGSVPLFVRCR